jgi:type I restriction enzyme M protein
VRLPNGVFSPYTDIPTNLLFFDRSGPTKEVWFFEIPLPEGRRQFTKTNPIQMPHFSGCLEWWNHRSESNTAWRVSADDIVRDGYNLDARNPRGREAETPLTPRELIGKLLTVEGEIGRHLREVEQMLARGL